ncbi:MAG TPA: CPBP family intramembrane glutamic endopeptidase [Pseudogracilibacillus sp.]|nr:CPBP family intramembrane glutamic endopeptidase [Pseudogracilibacillus sp.]
MNQGKIIHFILWLYGLSFGSAALFFMTGLGSHVFLLTAFMLLYMFMPFIAVLIVSKGIYKEKIARPLFLTGPFNWWWLLAICLPLLLVGITALFAPIFPSVTLDLSMSAYLNMLDDRSAQAMKDLFQVLPFHPLWLLIGQSLIAGITINALFAFGEEIGWRGFLLREFHQLGFWRASFLIGLIWGPWHAPLTIFAGHNYPSTPYFGLVMMTVFCMLMSPLLSFITIKSRSIIPAAFFHGIINGSASLGLMIVSGGNPELLNGLTGLVGFIILLLANIIIYMTTRKSIDQAYKNLLQRTR